MTVNIQTRIDRIGVAAVAALATALLIASGWALSAQGAGEGPSDPPGGGSARNVMQFQ